jgi:hypothetical protein
MTNLRSKKILMRTDSNTPKVMMIRTNTTKRYSKQLNLTQYSMKTELLSNKEGKKRDKRERWDAQTISMN